MKEKNQQVTHINSRVSWKGADLFAIYEYRELVAMFVKRYFTIIYKQTVLGPLWIVLNPLITTLLYSIVFGNIAKISTDGIPYLIFYLSGTTIWSLFSSTLSQTLNTFISNNGLFGKVYFPRLTSPVASTICALLNYLIQFILFLCFFFYFLLTNDILRPNMALLLLPLLVLQTALLGLGVGLIIASWTIKYRDLNVLITFALQLWMYVTPVVYPMSSTSERMRNILMLNPMAPVVEALRYAFTGTGVFSPLFLCISAVATVVVLFVGVLLFSHVEKTSVDII